MKKLPQLSVFLPAYNEEKNIGKTVDQVVKVVKKIAQQWEVIVVNDGSQDKTKEVVEELAEKEKGVRLINHGQNKGYGGAIKTGLYKSKYSLVAYMDSDGQFNFQEIKRFLPQLKKADLVLGFRKKRTDSYYRRLMADILRLANWILFGLNVRDVDCGFKLCQKKVIDKIKPLVTESAITETEFVVRVKKAGFKIAQVGVNHNPRVEGEQTGGKLSIVLKAAQEGLKLWWILQTEKNR